MVILGVVLVVLGLLFAVPILWILGLILIVLGLFFWVGPYHRRWY